MDVLILFSIVNFICILMLYAIVIFSYGKIIDNENSTSSLFEYRRQNEIQLSNLVRDVNVTDAQIKSFIHTMH